MGKPTFIMAFGADQLFWGLQVYDLGLGPKPINIRKDKITKELLCEKLKELEKESFSREAFKISQKLQKDNGVKVASDIIENVFKCYS